MVVRVYDFHVKGSDGLGRKWTVDGTMVDSFTPIDFPRLMEAILNDVFMKLTQGKAVYGKPGVGGCKGPYKYTEITLKLKEELEAS